MTAPITWAEASSPIYWSSIGINWNSPAKANSSLFAVSGSGSSTHLNLVSGSITLGVSAGNTNSSGMNFPESITFAINNGYSSVGGFTFSESVSMSIQNGYTQNDNATFADAVSLGVTGGYVNNTLYPESVTLAATNRFILGQFFQDTITMTVNGSAVTDNEFLWDDVSDAPTTWTTVDYPN